MKACLPQASREYSLFFSPTTEAFYYSRKVEKTQSEGTKFCGSVPLRE
jgi:hypothetical protein